MNGTSISREAILANNPIDKVIQSYGIELKKKGSELAGICPFHNDHSPSMRVNVSKQTFFCDPCNFGGSVIDFVRMKEGLTLGETMRKLSGQQLEVKSMTPRKEVCRYTYTDETGKILYKVVRFEPKDFRQCRLDESGKVQWNMEGVRRVLYNLPQVMKAKNVWIVEGEKDADNLNKLCLVATCNVGGSGKWMDAYTDYLKDKDIIICPDNDEAGQRHLDAVMKSLAGKVKSVGIVKLPTKFKDASDFIASFASEEEAGNSLCKMAADCVKITSGIDLPVYSIEEMERTYQNFIDKYDSCKLDLSAWLPAFRSKLRPLVPGEFAAILADTGTGKTAILQNIAYHARPLTVLMFELELPETLIFERYLQIQEEKSGQQIEDSFRNKTPVDWKSKKKLNHIFCCPVSKLNPELIEEYILKSELKIGKKPEVVMIDYIGLIKGKGGSRYEIVSQIAEQLKVIAKSTNTIIVAASQVHRKDDEEIRLHDAKDSGSIENSAGLVLGAWRNADGDKINIRVLKATKGGGGTLVPCEFHGETLRIWQEY